MDVNLEELKKNFLKIKDIRIKVSNVFGILEEHLMKLKMMYSEFVENNRQNQFVFGLDSFQFQSKLIDIEFEDMKRAFLVFRFWFLVKHKSRKQLNPKTTNEDQKTINELNFGTTDPVKPGTKYWVYGPH